jgi:CheY-like chemotaxis protein
VSHGGARETSPLSSRRLGEERWESCRGAHVLVVDDDIDMRELLAMRLQHVGCIASAVASGDEALALLDANDAATPVDLLLLDFRMPGLTGLQVLRRLLQGRAPIPAVLMTGFAETDVCVEALALGVHVLEKPFTFETLRRSLVLLLASSRLERRRLHVPIRLRRRKRSAVPTF